MLILECSQGCYAVNIWPGDIDLDLWPRKSIEFQTLLRTKYVPSLVKIHWRMLILECSQGCYAVKIWPCDLDFWPWKSIGFQLLLRTKYVPSLVKIHWRMLILECSQVLWRTEGRTDGSITISPRNFVGEGIINSIRSAVELSEGNLHLKVTNDELQNSVSMFAKSTVKRGWHGVGKDAAGLLIHIGRNIYILMKVR
jgi:hypothetical protein